MASVDSFTKRFADNSNESGFQFAFFCDICGQSNKKKIIFAISLILLGFFLLPGNVYATNNFLGWIGPCASGTNCDTTNQNTTGFCSDCVPIPVYSRSPGSLRGPAGIALDQLGNIFVADTGNSRVDKFNSAGVYQSQIGSFGLGNGQFLFNLGGDYIALDQSGNIYVTDAGVGKVSKFNSAGVFQSQISGPTGYGNGQFGFTGGIATDQSGNIYVVDTQNKRVQKFNSAGTFQGWIGSCNDSFGTNCDKSNGLTHATTTGFCSDCVTGGGGIIGQLLGLALDSTGNIYVGEGQQGWVDKFNSAGVFQSQIGVVGTYNPLSENQGQFQVPQGIAIDSSGNIYVVDSLHNRVVEFNSAGVYQSQIGCPSGACTGGSDSGQFSSPEGIALDSSGNIFVADTGNDRIEKFSSSTASSSSAVSTGPPALTPSPTTNQNTAPSSNSIQIPSWVKNNAKWWSQGQVGDSDFIKGMQYMIQNGIMKIPSSQGTASGSQAIPSWIKTDAGWWASGQVSDDEFVKGMQYLITNGIIVIKQ